MEELMGQLSELNTYEWTAIAVVGLVTLFIVGCICKIIFGKPDPKQYNRFSNTDLKRRLATDQRETNDKLR